MATLVERALPAFQAAGDDMALHVADSALAEVAFMRGQMGTQMEAYERAFSMLSGWATYRLGPVVLSGGGRFFGATPVSELLAWLDENEPRTGWDRVLGVYRAGALAMLGRFNEARTMLAEARAELAERGGGVLLAATTAFFTVWVELWADEPAAARDFGAQASGQFEGGGNWSSLGRPRLRTWHRRSTPLTGSTRPTPGPAARRSSARATTRDEMLWRQVRAESRVAVSTPKRSALRARRSRSARNR